jgi:hypothetical protein
LRRGLTARSIDSKLTALGKNERAISVSGYVHQGKVKYAAEAWAKTTVYKGSSRNHLVDQIERFRIGDKDSKREDDPLDCFCHGIAIALGNRQGFRDWSSAEICLELSPISPSTICSINSSIYWKCPHCATSRHSAYLRQTQAMQTGPCQSEPTFHDMAARQRLQRSKLYGFLMPEQSFRMEPL